MKRYHAPKITDMRWFKIVLHWYPTIRLIFYWANFFYQLVIMLFIQDTENMHIIPIPCSWHILICICAVKHINVTFEFLYVKNGQGIGSFAKWRWMLEPFLMALIDNHHYQGFPLPECWHTCHVEPLLHQQRKP